MDSAWQQGRGSRRKRHPNPGREQNSIQSSFLQVCAWFSKATNSGLYDLFARVFKAAWIVFRWPVKQQARHPYLASYKSKPSVFPLLENSKTD